MFTRFSAGRSQLRSTGNSIDTLRSECAQQVDGVEPLVLTISNPPTYAQVNEIYFKLNELIMALKRA